MLLLRLLHDAGIVLPDRASAVTTEVGAIRYDSRAVEPGDVFVAVRGTTTDGHQHVASAVAAGASLVVVEDEPASDIAVPCVRVRSSRLALADLAAARSGYPAKHLHVTGITGTDGKTTSTFLLSHVLAGMGYETGLLSTVAFKIGDRWEQNKYRQSTLESPEVQTTLARMVEARVSDAIVEATSHGLALNRVRNCAFDDAIVTNITSEHLEFHGTREEYMAAKALLLRAVRDNDYKRGRRFAAVNLDDEGAASLIPNSPVDVVTFGMSNQAEVRAKDVDCGATGSTFTLIAGQRRFQVRTGIPGLFNVYNSLGVIALLHGRGVDLDAALPHIATFDGVPGRMKRVDAGQSFSVVVDYAHTAASLEKVLTTLRPLTSGRLLVVFGSAGDRDREKRPVMGNVAARLADFSIFTDEDPRMEPSAQILDEIAAGARSAGAVAGRDFEIIADRRSAIHSGIALAEPGDVVLLAGKGHEQSMLVAGSSLPWDEESVAREALRGLGYGR
ncbi:MAG: UDP-N-acetylmuramoylalanyl-D-glutamate--2,6-diaminopimelate ligase [Chloroflexi bacterium]|nr:UDP-N-acetylmuramoylalanyl-D-glutamate--2,6-diaminopimelate ligase [Chloroflexota bacterium]